MTHLQRILFSLCAMFVVVAGITDLSVQAQRKTDPKKPKTWMTYTVKGGEFAVVESKLSLEEFVAEESTDPRYDMKTEKKLTVDGVAGREFSSLNKSSPAVVQLLATEQRLYRFAVSGADAKHDGVKRFFSSIRLGPQSAGIDVSPQANDPLEIDGERIYTGKEIDVKPKLLMKPEPQYTQQARSKGLTGTVVLKAVFSETGRVTNISVVRGLPLGLTEQAIGVARQIRFTPAMKDGNAVSLWMQLEYNFSLFDH